MRRLLVVSLLGSIASPRLAAQRAPDAFRIDPRIIAEAQDVWSVIASPRNPIWTGWNAARTPLLFYAPGIQDVLINHPRPPQDFRLYGGPVRFGDAKIWLRDGATFESQPGQNTSRTIAGTRTLMVADPEAGSNPYDDMGVIAHEAFHVFQDLGAPNKGANEMALVRYPILSAKNNLGFALEGAALAAALRAPNTAAFRAAAIRWLAVRHDRRAALRPPAVEYEDAVEFTEGLAKYVQYRLLETLQGRRPGPAMWWTRGFHGYGDLSVERDAVVAMLLRHMRGEINVNNDPFGAAPLRMRLYYSGMAQGLLLDRLAAPQWKARVFQPDVSLTSLVEQSLGATTEELAAALDEARREPGYDSLLSTKTALAERGHVRADSMVDAITHGPGTGVVIDYSGLAVPRVALSFTPFGITAVDSVRTIFALVPILLHFPDSSEVTQSQASPLLQDAGSKRLTFRLPRELSDDEVARALAAGTTPLVLDLPGAHLALRHATLRREGRDLVILLR
jgi:hypothetical protein